MYSYTFQAIFSHDSVSPKAVSSYNRVSHRDTQRTFCCITHNVQCDIFVWGRTKEAHDLRLCQVMDGIQAVNLKLNPDKCRFRVSGASYVGHLLTDQGVKPDPGNTAAVRLMTPPEDKHGLQRFLGLINYLCGRMWMGVSRSTTQQHSTNLRSLSPVLPCCKYLNEPLPAVLPADASQHGQGAVCPQNNKPALTETESRYDQN